MGQWRGPRRPENGSLSPGVLWEPPTGEVSISLSPVFCLPPPLSATAPPPPPALQMAAMTWLGVGGQVSFVRPPLEEFPEKATQDSGYSPGILEGAPSLRRGGPGESSSIYLGLQGSKQICCR